MKKIIIISLILISSIKVNYLYSQLPNQNTYLLKNIDTYTGYSGCWGYTAPNGREYAILGTTVGTSYVDITDSSNIREIDSVKGLNSIWREIKTYSHYAYVVSEATNSGLQIIDLQYLPDSVHLVKVWTYAGYTKTHTISQSDHYLYLNGGNSALNGGVTILDVLDPENPVKMGQWSTLYVHDCRILDDTIWASNIYTGQTSIINATNKSSLQFVKTFQSYPQSTVSTHNCAFSMDKKYLYTTNEITSPNGKLYVWDRRDINDITYIREWLPTNISSAVVHNIETYGNFAVVSHYTAGIRILDISKPADPMEVAWYDTYPSSNASQENGCWGAYMFPSGKIIGSDMVNGLFVIKTSINIVSIPELINPINISINASLTINFKWNKLNSAKLYVLKISTDSLFNNIIANDTIYIDTSKIISGFERGQKYFWKLTSIDASGNAYSSMIWNSTTIPPLYLNIKLLFEGLYSSAFNQTIRKDSVTVFLHQSISPFIVIDSAKSIVDSLSFLGSFKFLNATSGTYYISVKHFNSIETWSKSGGEILNPDGTIYNYDFTTSSNQAYGNNLKLKGSKYCLYSGDVNQDGFITLFDVIPIYNDASSFVAGRFIKTDLTGDGLVDLTDVTLCYNNSSVFVGIKRP